MLYYYISLSTGFIFASRKTVDELKKSELPNINPAEWQEISKEMFDSCKKAYIQHEYGNASGFLH